MQDRSLNSITMLNFVFIDSFPVLCQFRSNERFWNGFVKLILSVNLGPNFEWVPWHICDWLRWICVLLHEDIKLVYSCAQIYERVNNILTLKYTPMKLENVGKLERKRDRSNLVKIISPLLCANLIISEEAFSCMHKNANPQPVNQMIRVWALVLRAWMSHFFTRLNIRSQYL